MLRTRRPARRPYLRASQINWLRGVSPALKKMREPDERIFAVAACREAPDYSEAERAALALTEDGHLHRRSQRPAPRWARASKL